MPTKADVVKDQISSGDYDGGLCFDFSCDQSEMYNFFFYLEWTF